MNPPTASDARPAAPRPRYPERRHAARQAAAARAARRTTAAVTPAQRTRDPLLRPQRAWVRRWQRVMVPTLGSLAVHAVIVALGFATGTREGRREIVEQKIRIEVREPPPPPPPPVPAELPPAPARASKPAPAPKVAQEKPAPPPPVAPEPPPEPPKTPPPRVVGLSLESTAEGGSGPAFAVGNTREGRTAGEAVAPIEVPREAPAAAAGNQVATRLPASGVVYTPPRRKRERLPVYPERLKAQGVEAQVKVSVSIDATGKVTAVRILSPSAYPEFDEAARAAGMSEEFEPATRDGVPIPYSLPFTYRFRLEDQ